MRKTLTKTIALLLAIALAVGVGACAAPPGPSSPSFSSPSATGFPPPPEDTLERAYLTGLPKGADYPESRRVTAVMVNNIADSRPISGLSQAQLLYEIAVEGGITRFMALFEDFTTMPRVGSVRSARDQFFQLLIPSWGFLVHDGPNEAEHPNNILMRQYTYEELDLSPNSGATYRVDRNGMPTEYTEYTDAEHIRAAVRDNGLDDYRTYDSPIFGFTPYTQPPRTPADGPAHWVKVAHTPGQYETYFEYDAATGLYRMSMYNRLTRQIEATLDEATGEQLAFTNVVVVFAPFSVWPDTAPDNLPKVDYSGGGAFVMTNGGYEPCVWHKNGPNYPLRLNPIGSEADVLLNPGKTYVAVVDDTLSEAFLAALQAGAEA